jgi:very-short-patch-repair endonuclease
LTPPSVPLPASREGEMVDRRGQHWQTSSYLYDKLKLLAREKRGDPTPAEKWLWRAIRDRQMANTKFRRQHTIGQFIVDFYSAEIKLIIEVDGPVHQYTPEQDAIRQEYLESLGFKVIRFTNEHVLHSLDTVLEQIKLSITFSPSPLAGKEMGNRVNT